jgi:hypothetical protein
MLKDYFKFTAGASNTVYSAHKHGDKVVVGWTDKYSEFHCLEYLQESVSKYLDQGTWKLLEEDKLTIANVQQFCKDFDAVITVSGDGFKLQQGIGEYGTLHAHIENESRLKQAMDILSAHIVEQMGT